MIAWLLRDRTADLRFRLSASDLARELAKLGAEQRRVEYRRRVLANVALLKRTGATSPIEPSEGWR